MNRETFEKIPEIAKMIKEHNAFYCDKGGWYLCPDESDYGVENCLDGAWMMYQEQQKKVENLKTLFEEYELESSYHNPDYEKLELLSDRFKEIYSE